MELDSSRVFPVVASGSPAGAEDRAEDRDTALAGAASGAPAGVADRVSALAGAASAGAEERASALAGVAPGAPAGAEDRASAPAGVASGAPEERANERAGEVLVDLEDSGSSQDAQDVVSMESEGTGEEDLDEEGPPRGEAMPARARQVHRQVHFRDFGHWPENDILRLCSKEVVDKRREGIDRLIARLKRKCSPILGPQEFLIGIPHANDDEKHRGELWNVVRAFASTKMHFLGLLLTQLMTAAIVNPLTYPFMAGWLACPAACQQALLVGTARRARPWRPSPCSAFTLRTHPCGFSGSSSIDASQSASASAWRPSLP